MEPVRQSANLPHPQSVTNPTRLLGLRSRPKMVGVVRLKVSDPPGTKVTLRTGMLNPQALSLHQKPAGAPSIDLNIWPGAAATKSGSPRFTFHGFRYGGKYRLTQQPEGRLGYRHFLGVGQRANRRVPPVPTRA